MARYNSTSLALAEEAAAHDCFTEVEGYLSSEDGYWLSNDIWMKDSAAFSSRGISLENVRRDVIADFSTAPAGRVRTELKYYVLWALSTGVISASTFALNYRPALMDLGRLLQEREYTEGLSAVVLTEEELSRELSLRAGGEITLKVYRMGETLELTARLPQEDRSEG